MAPACQYPTPPLVFIQQRLSANPVLGNPKDVEMDLALRGREETDAKWADANIGPLVPGGRNRAMGATGPNNGGGGVNGG